MAGGEGAKERRRLKRLAETGSASAATENKTPDAKASAPPAKRDNTGPPKRDNNGPPARDNRGPPNRANTGFSKDGWKDKKFDNKPKRFSDSPKGNWKDKKFEKKPFIKKGGTPTRKASSKSKKPKHLKRKLEQVSEDEEAKQKVLKDLEEFETKKEELSQQNKRPKNNSYEKKTEDVSMSKATTRQKEPTLVEEETGALPVEEESFVRSTRATKTEEAEEESASEEDSATPAAMDESDDESKDEEAEEESVSEEDPEIPAAMDESKDEEAVEEKDSDDGEAEGESAAEIQADDKNDAKGDSRSDGDSSDSDDSDSEDEGEEGRRQRGKRRKGRKDTAALIQETEKEVEAKKAAKKSAEKEDGEKKGDPNKKTLRRDDKRKCIGRNPVTSFKLGEKYPAKVVYIKPFGVFFDIGCHSDAFCHVSRLQDDYIKNPTDMFKEGDEVSARVVEVDRRAKRITVSLQSDARAEDERASIEARQKRKEIIKNKETKKKRDEEPPPAAAKIVIKAPPRITQAPASRPRAPTNTPRPRAPTSTMPPQQKDESQMTPAELKRARKLARRASRRDEQGEEAPQ
jgi:predicted RNA-binding protein with RPS1 domain